MYDQNKLLEILKIAEYRCIDSNGKCFPSNSVYLEISKKMKELDSDINPKHIYTIMNSNRRGIYDTVLEAFDINKDIEKSLNESYNDSVNTSLFEKSSKSDNKVFRLIISDKYWNDIKSVVRKYGNRRYLKLKPGEWSNVFAKKIWEQTKIPCAFTFKNSTVFPSHYAPNVLSDLMLYAKNARQF